MSFPRLSLDTIGRVATLLPPEISRMLYCSLDRRFMQALARMVPLWTSLDLGTIVADHPLTSHVVEKMLVDGPHLDSFRLVLGQRRRIHDNSYGDLKRVLKESTLVRLLHLSTELAATICEKERSEESLDAEYNQLLTGAVLSGHCFQRLARVKLIGKSFHVTVHNLSLPALSDMSIEDVVIEWTTCTFPRLNKLHISLGELSTFDCLPIIDAIQANHSLCHLRLSSSKSAIAEDWGASIPQSIVSSNLESMTVDFPLFPVHSWLDYILAYLRLPRLRLLDVKSPTFQWITPNAITGLPSILPPILDLFGWTNLNMQRVARSFRLRHSQRAPYIALTIEAGAGVLNIESNLSRESTGIVRLIQVLGFVMNERGEIIIDWDDVLDGFIPSITFCGKVVVLLKGNRLLHAALSLHAGFRPYEIAYKMDEEPSFPSEIDMVSKSEYAYVSREHNVDNVQLGCYLAFVKALRKE